MEEYKPGVRKKINSLDEIYDGKKLILKEFINLDLTGLDLSIIPKEQWENCIFINTSFKNTGIKFVPNKLAKLSSEEVLNFGLTNYYYKSGVAMFFCDFSDNDLTNLTREDFCVDSHNEVITYGCNFTNTGINFLKTLINIKLDSYYQEYDFDSEYWKFVSGSVNWPDFIDINTIIKNPFLSVPSFRVLNAIAAYVYDMNRKSMVTTGYRIDSSGKTLWDYSGGDDVYKSGIVNKCEEFLKYDKQGYGKKLYDKLSPFMSLNEKFEFFIFSIRYLNIKNVDFEDIPVEVLRYYTIQNNKFENVVFNYPINELFKLWSGHFLDIASGYENEYKEFFLPQICYSSWQENLYAKKRMSDSAITFFTKVYLELSRTCNANCSFCRNKSFGDSTYDIEKIKETLNQIKKYINAVVIGGGEPTLKIDDVKELHQSITLSNFDWHMFTNGTKPSFIHDDYIMDKFKLNLSRHAVDDLENAKIFGVNIKNIMSSSDIEKLNVRNGEVTLNAVCFKGGLDSFEKIVDYIKYASEIGCKKVLIQDLQKEISLGNNGFKNNDLCIDSDILPRVREYLKINGYKEKYPVYATGGYVSYIFKNKDGFSVTLQSYISQDELDRQWPKSIKRAFDLSIDPSGNLYENWNQTTGLVKTLRKTGESHITKTK